MRGEYRPSCAQERGKGSVEGVDPGDVAAGRRALERLTAVAVGVHRLEAGARRVAEAVGVAELVRRDVADVVHIACGLVATVALATEVRPVDRGVEDGVALD